MSISLGCGWKNENQQRTQLYFFHNQTLKIVWILKVFSTLLFHAWRKTFRPTRGRYKRVRDAESPLSISTILRDVLFELTYLLLLVQSVHFICYETVINERSSPLAFRPVRSVDIFNWKTSLLVYTVCLFKN